MSTTNNIPQRGDLYIHKQSKHVWRVTYYKAAWEFGPACVNLSCVTGKTILERSWSMKEFTKKFRKA